jgi:hypothetical protein
MLLREIQLRVRKYDSVGYYQTYPNIKLEVGCLG